MLEEPEREPGPPQRPLDQPTVAADAERAVAIGGNVSDSTIVTGTLYRLGIERRSVRIALGAFVGVLVLGAALVIYQTVQPLLAGPGRMRGGVNVAVAEFGGLDDQGRPIQMQKARELADAVFNSLQNQLNSTDAEAGLSIEVWPPAKTGSIVGSSREDRARQAGLKALDIAADVVVYGNIQAGADKTSFVPEFYLAPTKLLGDEELGGQYEFGSSVESKGNLNLPGTFEVLRDKLQARTKALELFTYGIGHYERNEFGRAANYLKLAEQEGWGDEQPGDDQQSRDRHDGKEFLYTLAGFAIGRNGDFEGAKQYFDDARTLNPTYARAQMGSAEMLFELEGGQRDCAADRVDPEKLREALHGFEQARDAPLQPAESNIQTKVMFGFGQVYLCLSLAQKEDDWAAAKQAFASVSLEYDAGNKRIKDLAAEAHGNLGLIILLGPAESADKTAAFRAAAAEYGTAADLSLRRDRQAYFERMVGYLDCRAGEFAAAETAFTRAISVEPDAATQSSYEELRRQLLDERVCR